MTRQLLLVAVFAATLCSTLVQAQSKGTSVPPPWGDPDLQGEFTNSDESPIPMQRPDALAGLTLNAMSAGELDRLIDERNAARDEADRQGWELRSPLGVARAGEAAAIAK
jgi:hypothetical protein